MRERFDSEYIHSELERLGNQLEAPLTVYLIGGGYGEPCDGGSAVVVVVQHYAQCGSEVN